MSDAPAMPTPPPLQRARNATNITLKMLVVAGLTLGLLIPLAMIGGVVRERLQLRNKAVSEITATWGQAQNLVGPVLSVPYRYRFKTVREERVDGAIERREVEETAVAVAYFLPRSLSVHGEMTPEVRHRGIYETAVYRVRLHVEGSFHPAAWDDWKISPEDILWDEAEVSLGVNDLRGTQERVSMRWGDRDVALLPGSRVPDFPAGLHGRLRDTGWRGGEIAFDATLSLNGSGPLRVAPVGVENAVNLRSSWPDPSFQGAFLPAQRRVDPSGFDATWNVTFYGRTYPQQWTSRDSTGYSAGAVNQSLFGVELLTMVDAYRLTERAVKYGVLFIVLVFTGFFLCEVLVRLRVHPFQYTLVGVALALFYLLLLSLSEFVGFGPAYGIAAAACTLLVSSYTASVLRGARRAGGVAAGLAVIYGLLYVILSLQDYALLVGAAGLFAALALAMYATRKVDWYAPRE